MSTMQPWQGISASYQTCKLAYLHCPLCIASKVSSSLQAEGNTFIEAYGRILGTQITCCWLAVLLSFMPPRMLKRCFPPMVTGLTIFLIGAGLIGSGLKVSSATLQHC